MKFRRIFVILLSLFCLDCHAEESPLDIIFSSVDLIEMSTENLQKDLFSLKEKLNQSEQTLETLQTSYEQSESSLASVQEQLNQEVKKSEKLEEQQSRYESRLRFYRISTPVLTVYATASTVALIIILRRKANDNLQP